MELKKAIKNTRSWSYRQGFKKGIEISNNNHREYGWMADEQNQLAVYGFQKQIREGVDKQGNKLNQQQIEWRKGVVDGIKQTYSKFGANLMGRREESPFERRERIHNYGEPKPYDGTSHWSEDYE